MGLKKVNLEAGHFSDAEWDRVYSFGQFHGLTINEAIEKLQEYREWLFRMYPSMMDFKFSQHTYIEDMFPSGLREETDVELEKGLGKKKKRLDKIRREALKLEQELNE